MFAGVQSAPAAMGTKGVSRARLPLIDIQTLRKGARRHIEAGAVTVRLRRRTRGRDQSGRLHRPMRAGAR